MIHRYTRNKLLKFFLIISALVCLSAGIPRVRPIDRMLPVVDLFVSEQAGSLNSPMIERIRSRVQILDSGKDIDGALSMADSLQMLVQSFRSDSTVMSELYYYSGICNLIAARYNNAILNLIHSADIRDRIGLIDQRYTTAIFNIGVAYNYLGDYIRVKEYMLMYIPLAEKLFGENSQEVASAYATLIGASIGSKEYSNFTDYTSRAFAIFGNNNQAFTGRDLSNLYSSIGTGYFRMEDYSKARIYFEQAESVIESGNIAPDQNYITLINSLAVTYHNLNMAEKEEEYFNKGIKHANVDNSFLSFNMINSYAIALGNSGYVDQADDLLNGLLERSGNVYGTGSRFHIEVMKNYAEFLLIYRKDIEGSISLFSECRKYLLRHKEDVSLREEVLSGFARALFQSGQSVNALEIIQELLFYGKEMDASQILYSNPDPDQIKADRRYLSVLKSKYEILWDLYSDTGAFAILEAAANTSELIISVIDKIRINISEEESRIVLGNRYRDSYLMAIRDFELCYKNTGEQRYLEKTFEFTEKSKVAGLLAATRELNAIQFHIPPDIAELEKSLQREISIYNSKISMEVDRENPDKAMLAELNDKLLGTIKGRDSLARTFEKDYPGYYTLKYNTTAPEMKDIPAIVGKNINYLNYILSDSMLYIFIINRKYNELLSFKTDTLLLRCIKDFRRLLSDPSKAENARAEFINYQKVGNKLYSVLIEPVSKYFISNNLLISPDNILSYLPFETIISSEYKGDGILYRELDYLMNDYNISYTYSATFMKEIVTREYGRISDLVAFAPGYTEDDPDSSFLRRIEGNIIIPDLPFARQEAEFVSGISGGSLYLNDKARESVFKKIAGDFDIIHLAMHTFLSDQNPMNSAMIFSLVDDTPEDGMLHTYEVYGIPLQTKMVVLSSCNTGTGILSTGEGILSLARGFLYSGSQSVVMSMWEIEDKSGTEIIKMFYENLKNGSTKSKALRKSRSDYLKKANQLKSHPYFWSALVVYGDNDSVYHSTRKLTGLAIALAISGILIFIYFWKRRYS